MIRVKKCPSDRQSEELFMKTLNTIQKLAKLGKILSKIVYILSMIGAIGAGVGVVLMATMGEDAIAKSKESLMQAGEKSAIEQLDKMDVPFLIVIMCVAVAFCVAEAVISKFAEKYFTNELADGTPFTLRGAKELMRLGIIQAAVSIGTSTVCGAALAIASASIKSLENETFNGMSFGLGITFIIVSLICRLGAELTEGKTEAAPAPEVAPAPEAAPAVEEAPAPEAAE